MESMEGEELLCWIIEKLKTIDPRVVGDDLLPGYGDELEEFCRSRDPEKAKFLYEFPLVRLKALKEGIIIHEMFMTILSMTEEEVKDLIPGDHRLLEIYRLSQDDPVAARGELKRAYSPSYISTLLEEF